MVRNERGAAGLSGPVPGREAEEKPSRVCGLEVAGHLSSECLCGRGWVGAWKPDLCPVTALLRLAAEGKMGAPVHHL